MGKRWPAVILQWAKQGIGIDLVARAVQKTAAIVTTDIVSLRGNGRVIDIFRATSI